MADKTISLTIPEDVISALDQRAASIGFSREQFITDLLKGSVGLMDEMTSSDPADTISVGLIDEMTSSDPASTIRVTIEFPQQALKTYELAATILGTSTSELIARALEIGRIANLDVCREHALKQAREHENDTRH